MKVWVPPHMMLREVNHGDHEWLLSLHNDAEVLRNLTDPTPVTLQQHLNWWSRTESSERERRLVFEVNNAPVGFTKFYNIDFVNKNCVLGADIHKDFRGKGFAKFMWSEMLKQCFQTWRLHRVSLSTAEYNVVGRHVYKNLGFKEEGRLSQSLYRDGKYYDQICMCLFQHEWASLDVDT